MPRTSSQIGAIMSSGISPNSFSEFCWQRTPLGHTTAATAWRGEDTQPEFCWLCTKWRMSDAVVTKCRSRHAHLEERLLERLKRELLLVQQPAEQVVAAKKGRRNGPSKHVEMLSCKTASVHEE
eukprot:5836205-Pleurochrysis_carterae.AAC.1